MLPTMRGGKFIGEDGNEQGPVEAEIELVDLNGDGQPEIFVSVSDPSGMMFGLTGASLTLYIKDKTGQWRQSLGFPALGYTVLKEKD